MQYITRKGNFDSGHRVMNEQYKCYNLHGHTYLYELTFNFQEMEDIAEILGVNIILEKGYYYCCNIEDGFEGNKNSSYQRSKINGWNYQIIDSIANKSNFKRAEIIALFPKGYKSILEFFPNFWCVANFTRIFKRKNTRREFT